MKKIIMPKYITETQIEEILNDFITPSFSTHLDFSDTEFVSPYAAVLLLILFEKTIKELNKKIHLILSRPKVKVKPCMYILARIGFFDSIPLEIKCYPYKPKTKGNPKGKNDAILEITKIEKQSFGEIMEKVEKAIISNTDYPSDQKKDICIMVSEMMQNIFYHSKAPNSGIIAVQKFEYYNYMQMIIADSGIGIPESLRTSEEYKNKKMTDSELIFEAVKLGVSSFGKKEDRGEGLAKCVELAKVHNAEIFVRSNNAYANIIFNNRRGHMAESHFLAGTQIFVNFPC